MTGSVKASDVHSVSGSCGENQAKLIINFNKTGAKWTLLFSKKIDSVTVALDMMFQFDPDKMFPNKNLTSSESCFLLFQTSPNSENSVSSLLTSSVYH